MSKALATKNVAAVLLAVAMVFGFAFSFATPAKADVISDLQAQIQALLAQIQALQGGNTSGGACVNFTFTTNFRQGQSGAEVMQIQKFLNQSADTQVAATGAGSAGNETSYFGPATKAAVIKFQNKYAADILTPVGLSTGNGNWYASTRAKANALAAACTPGSGNTGGNTGGTVGGTLQVAAGTQPANSLAPESASRVPFTTFTLTNTSAAAVTVNNVTVQKTGLGDKAVFDGIILVDSSGQALGNSKTMNSNNQAVLDAGITLQPGQSATLTVSGNMISNLDGTPSYAGQIIGLSVVGVSSNGTVSGSLPISGAMHTINGTLSIGGLQLSVGPTDPDTDTLDTTGKEIGTTGFTFAAVRAQNTGSVEDVWVKSIRWNQSGSASAGDLANVVTIVDGTSYPTTVSADGKYYTTVFPGNGIEIQKGLQKEFSVKADIVSGPNRTIQFDLYKASDFYVVGETYGYGITPSANTTASSEDDSQLTTTNPFFDGTKVTINAGTVSSVSRATEVAAQNIVELSPNQPLGGFAVDIKGEAITVASLTFGFDITSSDTTETASNIDNITLVDENGVVVAGPVDGTTGTGTDGKVTFTDTVTFNTGRHVYTLKAQLDSSFEDGDTIVATTTPSTYWTTVRGAVTGNSITLTNGHVSGNTMTVKAGGVALSINSSPAARTIVSGVSQQTVGAIRFDGSASGEDVRFSSIKVMYNDDDGDLGSGEDPINCYAYNGATRLNNTAVNPTTDDTDETFTFDTMLTVAKGTNLVVDIKCDIPASAAGEFNFGLNADGSTTAASFTGTGMTSSQTVTPTLPSTTDIAGNDQTVTGSGALTVAEDSSSPSYAIAAGGSTGVTVGVLRFNGTNEDMNLKKIGLTMSNSSASSTPSDLTQVTLWDGATQVGTAFFSGSNRYATTTLTTSVTIPANSFKLITVKADLADIGTGLAGDSGVLVQVDYDGESSVSAGGCSTEAQGASSGQQICSTTSSDTSFDGVRMFRAYPTFSSLNTGLSTTLINGSENTLYRFSITASPSAGAADLGISLNELTVNLATSTATTTDLKIYAFTNSSFSSPVSGFTDGLLTGTVSTPVSGDNEYDLGSDELVIPAGTTYYFEVRGTVTITATTGTSQVTTRISGDSAYLSLSTLMATAATADNEGTNDDFIWSPNSTTTSSTDHVDWTNGYGVSGLPSGGSTVFSLSKEN